VDREQIEHRMALWMIRRAKEHHRRYPNAETPPIGNLLHLMLAQLDEDTELNGLGNLPASEFYAAWREAAWSVLDERHEIYRSPAGENNPSR
jgi:hypothetical protein